MFVLSWASSGTAVAYHTGYIHTEQQTNTAGNGASSSSNEYASLTSSFILVSNVLEAPIKFICFLKIFLKL